MLLVNLTVERPWLALCRHSGIFRRDEEVGSTLSRSAAYPVTLELG
jgi:hypothetical protein